MIRPLKATFPCPPFHSVISGITKGFSLIDGAFQPKDDVGRENNITHPNIILAIV
jgi:hypothetical protein